jgi:fluoroquinolone transport system permease protein
MKDSLKYDIILQWRQGFWLVYMVITLIYLAIIFNVPTENRYIMSMVFILTDTSMLGIIFIGALILLEKQQNLQHAMWVTPLRPERYIWSKALSLTLLSFTMSSLLLFLPNGFRQEFLWVLAAVVLTSIIFTLFGMAISASAKTVNGYLAVVMGGSLAALAPLAPYLVLDRPLWLIIFPINAALDIIWLESASAGRLLAGTLILIIWVYVAFRFSLQQYKSKILK